MQSGYETGRRPAGDDGRRNARANCLPSLDSDYTLVAKLNAFHIFNVHIPRWAPFSISAPIFTDWTMRRDILSGRYPRTQWTPEKSNEVGVKGQPSPSAGNKLSRR